ncbi:MAG TPA: rhodanese-like domain-containing protein [Acidobacteriaceae bacterium]|jgi:rhodanese-related sulfurtransferase|nr:rhodanese-like domain-containing protein [Acidobacteriaceae bacterium]
MLVMVAVICVIVLLVAVQVKRGRDRRELERYSITAEDLHTLVASNQDVAIFDVRLPLDLLGHSVLIPGAQRLAPEEVMANPSLIPRDRDSIVYCTCPSDETSRAVLHRALAKGLVRIRFLKGGLEGWKSKGFPVEPYDKPFHLSSGGNNAAVTH